jgi:hypothetical protein
MRWKERRASKHDSHITCVHGLLVRICSPAFFCCCFESGWTCWGRGVKVGDVARACGDDARPRRGEGALELGALTATR